MMHQHFTLAENLTVLDNITIGTASHWSFKPNTTAARARLHRLAKTFGLALVDPDR
jgi:simple sugar transport system ATP-binding protein